MRDHTYLLTLALCLGMALMAEAQNTTVLELSGVVMAGTIRDSVHVHLDQGHGYPAIDLYLPLDSSGYYLGYVHIQSTQIDVTTSTACGSAPSGPDYSLSFDHNEPVDTLSGSFEILYCNGYMDCQGIAEGPNIFGTPCKTTQGGSGVWTIDCDCDRGCLDFPDHHFGKKD